MSELAKALKKVELIRIPHRLDLQREKYRKKEIEISKKEFKKPYHLLVIMLNQGLIPGYDRTTQRDIAKMFNKLGSDLTYQKVNHDIKLVTDRFGIKDLVRANVGTVKDGVKTISASTNPEEDNWFGWCINCEQKFTPDERAKGSLCHRCLGTVPIPKERKLCQCGEYFYPTAKNGNLCPTCIARNKQFQESTLTSYYQGVL